MKTPQTPYPELAKALGMPSDGKTELWLKREDLHHFGSHKGRSIPAMIDYYWRKHEIFNFVISSSGNAALAGALAVQHHNLNNPDRPITLTIFVGEKIAAEKLRTLKNIHDPRIIIQRVTNPKQQAFQMEKSGAAKFLRQSTDDEALKGYHELAKELDHIPNLQAIFIPTSSGTTAQALGEAFVTLTQKPQIHIVQTEAVHPIAETFSPSETNTTESIAGAIVDNIAHRKTSVVKTIKNSGGSGWIVSDAEIQKVIGMVKNTTTISLSPNSALGIAGLQKALQHNWEVRGAVVCLVTGA